MGCVDVRARRGWARDLWMAGLLLLCACQSHPFTYRPNQRVARTRINEVVLRSTDTDILFVIDNSGSMAEEHANLIANTTIFIEELARSENDYRVGIVTTDLHNTNDRGQLRLQRATAGALSDAGCGIGTSEAGIRFLESPDLEDPEIEAKRCRLVEDFIATVQSLGTGGAGREAGLLAAEWALDPERDINGDFMREDADLALIFMSDEEDCSFADYSQFTDFSNAGCYELVQSAIPPDEHVSFFAKIKGSITKVRAAAIIGGVLVGQEGAAFIPRGCHLDGPDASAACGCWSATDEDFFCEWLEGFGHPCSEIAPCFGRDTCAPDGVECDSARCDALPGVRYHDFTRQLRTRRLRAGFSGGTFEDSICQANYDETLLTIARTVVLSNCFNLNVPILEEGLIELTLQRPDEEGRIHEYVLPSLGEEGSVTCGSCGDCPEGAWRVVNETTICLECGLIKQSGDSFSLSVFNEVTDPWVGD